MVVVSAPNRVRSTQSQLCPLKSRRFNTPDVAAVHFFPSLRKFHGMLEGLSSRVASPDFVGRTDELARLTSAALAASAGTPGFVLIGGESGVGKSRLLQEFALRAIDDGAQRPCRATASTSVRRSSPMPRWLGPCEMSKSVSWRRSWVPARLRSRHCCLSSKLPKRLRLRPRWLRASCSNCSWRCSAGSASVGPAEVAGRPMLGRPRCRSA